MKLFVLLMIYRGIVHTILQAQNLCVIETTIGDNSTTNISLNSSNFGNLPYSNILKINSEHFEAKASNLSIFLTSYQRKGK